jgi:hypothetical protein
MAERLDLWCVDFVELRSFSSVEGRLLRELKILSLNIDF